MMTLTLQRSDGVTRELFILIAFIWGTTTMKDKRAAIAVFGFALLAIAFTIAGPTPAASAADAAVTYKAKCVACHGAKAEKGFNPAKSDGELLAVMLKGVKPKMPAYEKSLGAEDSKALIAYMKQLRK
jgi:mono/diheme cytochrome c family protein